VWRTRLSPELSPSCGHLAKTPWGTRLSPELSPSCYQLAKMPWVTRVLVNVSPFCNQLRKPSYGAGLFELSPPCGQLFKSSLGAKPNFLVRDEGLTLFGNFSCKNDVGSEVVVQKSVFEPLPRDSLKQVRLTVFCSVLRPIVGGTPSELSPPCDQLAKTPWGTRLSPELSPPCGQLAKTPWGARLLPKNLFSNPCPETRSNRSV